MKKSRDREGTEPKPKRRFEVVDLSEDAEELPEKRDASTQTPSREGGKGKEEDVEEGDGGGREEGKPRFRSVKRFKSAVSAMLDSSGLREKILKDCEREKGKHEELQDKLRSTLRRLDDVSDFSSDEAKEIASSCRVLKERLKRVRTRFVGHRDAARWIGLFSSFLLGGGDENHCALCDNRLCRRSVVVLRCSHFLCFDCYNKTEYHEVSEEDSKKYHLEGRPKLKRCPTCREYVVESHEELVMPKAMARDRVNRDLVETLVAESMNGANLWTIAVDEDDEDAAQEEEEEYDEDEDDCDSSSGSEESGLPSVFSSYLTSSLPGPDKARKPRPVHPSLF